MKLFKHSFFLFILTGVLSLSVFGADNFGLTNTQRIIIETESFLRHSGYRTLLPENGIVKAINGSSSVKVKLISLSSDSKIDQGVVCYVSTSDSDIFDKLSSDLESFASLHNITINLIRAE